MNAYYQPQSSGIEWPIPSSEMLSQLVQEPPSVPKLRQQGAIFDDLEKQMAAFRAEHEAVLKQVREHFVFPRDSSVAIFLTEHRSLPQILLEAAPWLRTCFGNEPIFNLRAPIDEAGSRTLYAVVIWTGTVRDVRDALARFDDSWWIAHSRKASGYLTFTYELV